MPMKEVLGVIPGLAKYAFLTGECELARFPCVLPIVPSRTSAYVRQRTPMTKHPVIQYPQLETRRFLQALLRHRIWGFPR